MRAWAVAAACLVVVSCVVAIGDDGVDRPNGDLSDMPLTLSTSDGPDVCADMCLDDPSCVAWSYGKATTDGGCTEPSTYPLCWLKGTAKHFTMNPCRVSGSRNPTLAVPFAYPLPVTHIKPSGWLKNQLQIQADGLSGYLSLFWADISDSIWIGGTADGGLHERTPYWLNGVIPLAFLLDDPDLIAQVEYYVDYILDHQLEDGWFGPTDSMDPWSRFPLCLALLQYYQSTEDSRIIPALYNFMHYLFPLLIDTPLTSWAAYRWQDMALAVEYIYDNYLIEGEEQFLLDLIELLHYQGFDWKAYFRYAFPTEPAVLPLLDNHGVNNGQAVKSEAVYYRFSRDSDDVASTNERINKLDMYHGQASGIFSCDEHLAGLMPSRGTELCTVVETMFSYDVSFSVIGNLTYVDFAERVALNALQATLTDDIWEHQYLQQSNEINSMVCDDHVWAFDGPNSNIYGLEPNYGCCTANYHQGYPKYVTNAIMLTPDNGLVILHYGPMVLETVIAATSNKVSLNMTTDYPFAETISIATQASQSFTLYMRVPGWVKNTGDWVVSDSLGVKYTPAPGTLLKIQIPSGAGTISIQITMQIEVTRRYNNAAAIMRGPLLYALWIPHNTTVLAHYAYESDDLQMLPTSPWQYGIRLSNDNDPTADLTFSTTNDMTNPFAEESCPLTISAWAKPLTQWVEEQDAAAAPPVSPVSVGADTPVVVKLKPYGSTKLRIAEIPTYLD